MSAFSVALSFEYKNMIDEISTKLAVHAVDDGLGAVGSAALKSDWKGRRGF